ncbi:anthranilate synthase component I [Segniliparus rugosus]|uniref:Anthranilate synthase component 1 n=1 Tax=Segniliparus rugosus (strain ATCC BAA-974 / DSM 45345 / CCUG 50838 / CIP 108380 / JCM 13579 / CDC 945) TaxID=679197 RepID=E5XQV8_SEGRC|nr:anthranilate synthase component I [Segniliparus rugosus]EFV13249.1 anthranilate synthase component I [Segniliparus rugosus ATCC BAA-974]
MTVSALTGNAASHTTTRAEFEALAGGRRVVPVTRRLLADAETPVSAFRKLAGDRAGTFLLESAEHGKTWSQWSFIGVRTSATLTSVDGKAVWRGAPPEGIPTEGEPLQVLNEAVRALATDPIPGLPPLTSGLVGYLSYDVVRWLEKLPERTQDDLRLPAMTMLLVSDLAVFDHHANIITLIANTFLPESTGADLDALYAQALARLDTMTSDLAAPSPSTVSVFDWPSAEFDSQLTEEEYGRNVRAVVAEIEAGEAFQVVPSQRYSMPTQADPLDVYRVLRVNNPSSHMYLIRVPGEDGSTAFHIVGSSPEALVTVRGRTVTTRPIAGTQPRGGTGEDDLLFEKRLTDDPKENAEHLMLVDLGRNDLGRVCVPGSVRVARFRVVERYSHVMHLVSTVSGQLASDQTALDAVLSCFPAGTLSGAPKVRAMEIIEEVELTRRGLYGGVVGYFDFTGQADTAIAIRTAVVKDDVAYVQAGGGVVLDSDPSSEYWESRNKANTVLSAIAAAHTMRSPNENKTERP